MDFMIVLGILVGSQTLPLNVRIDPLYILIKISTKKLIQGLSIYMGFPDLDCSKSSVIKEITSFIR